MKLSSKQVAEMQIITKLNIQNNRPTPIKSNAKDGGNKIKDSYVKQKDYSNYDLYSPKSLNENKIYQPLTDAERFKGIKLTNAIGVNGSNGEVSIIPTWVESNNKTLTPKIRKLLDEGSNEDIPILKFTGNRLKIEKNACYRLRAGEYGMHAYVVDKYGAGNYKATYDMPAQDFYPFMSPDKWVKIHKNATLLTAFRQKNLEECFYFMSVFGKPTTPREFLLELGAPYDEYIKIGDYEDEIMIDSAGGMYTRELIEGFNIDINRQDFRELNLPPGTIYRIEGKDYIVDENWRLQVPKDVICTPGRIEIIKPNNRIEI